MRQIKFSGVAGPTSMNEAFMRKDLLKVVSKMVPLIAKRMGVTLTIPQVPYTVTDPTLGSGEFECYRSFVGAGKDAIRINFPKSGGSAGVHSISLFQKFDDTQAVKHIIIPSRFNIVQIMDHIIYALKYDYGKLGENYNIKDWKKQLQEAESHRQHIKDWMFSSGEGIINEINRRGSDWNTLLSSYLGYLRDVGARIRTPALTTFQATCRRVLDAEGQDQAANNVPHVDVSVGGPQRIVPDAESESTFEDELVNDEHIQKFEFMEFIFNRILADDPRWKGVYIYGRGGIGKSHTAKKMLVSQPNAYYTKGKIEGYRGLLQVIFDHKDGEIVILDDIITDDDMKNTTIQNILKGVLETGTDRFVRVERKAKVGGEAGGLINNEEPQTVSPSDTIDFTSDAGVGGNEDLYNFRVTSSFVIITNYKKVPQPIQDRCHTLAMIFTEEQVIDIINRALANVEPKNVDIDTKKFILEWIKERMKSRYALQPLSFRVYSRIAEIYINAKNQGIDELTWQKWAFTALRQQMQGT
mgnify:CR=1 FL=1